MFSFGHLGIYLILAPQSKNGKIRPKVERPPFGGNSQIIGRKKLKAHLMSSTTNHHGGRSCRKSEQVENGWVNDGKVPICLTLILNHKFLWCWCWWQWFCKKIQTSTLTFKGLLFLQIWESILCNWRSANACILDVFLSVKFSTKFKSKFIGFKDSLISNYTDKRNNSSDSTDVSMLRFGRDM